MSKRINCMYCNNFIPPEFKEPLNFLSKVKTNAKCKKGKRVMFRQPKDFYDGGGWFRYCDEYSDKNISSTIMNFKQLKNEQEENQIFEEILKKKI